MTMLCDRCGGRQHVYSTRVAGEHRVRYVRCGGCSTTTKHIVASTRRKLSVLVATTEGMDRVTITKQELAARYGVSVRTIERWMRRDILPPAIRFGGIVRFRLSDIEQRESEQSKQTS